MTGIPLTYQWLSPDKYKINYSNLTKDIWNFDFWVLEMKVLVLSVSIYFSCLSQNIISRFSVSLQNAFKRVGHFHFFSLEFSFLRFSQFFSFFSGFFAGYCGNKNWLFMLSFSRLRKKFFFQFFRWVDLGFLLYNFLCLTTKAKRYDQMKRNDEFHTTVNLTNKILRLSLDNDSSGSWIIRGTLNIMKWVRVSFTAVRPDIADDNRK